MQILDDISKRWKHPSALNSGRIAPLPSFGQADVTGHTLP